MLPLSDRCVAAKSGLRGLKISPIRPKGMDAKTESRRRRERMRIPIPGIVQSREGSEVQWSELTRLVDVTPFGASFLISRRIDVGRLVHLTLPMPRQLRCFDHAEDQYRVWALVRYIKPLPASALTSEKYKYRFAVGVAFVGKNPPGSYKLQPGTLYSTNLEEADSLTEGLHSAAARGSLSKGGQSSDQDSGADSTGEMTGETASRRGDARDGTRLNVPVDVILEVVGYAGSISSMREHTVTENISRRGASVFTTFNVARGTRVRLTSAHHHLSINAFVLVHRIGADGLPRLHLKFTDEQWPLEGVV